MIYDAIDREAESERLRDDVLIAHLAHGCDEVTPIERRAICKRAAVEIAELRAALPAPVRVTEKGYRAAGNRYAELRHSSVGTCDDHARAIVEAALKETER